MKSSTAIIFYILLLFVHFHGYQFPYLEILRTQFQHSFEEKCIRKYPTVVDKFVRKLEDPGDRYLMYVFEELRLKNGGLGDRLAGLVSAMAMSLRFNRTLLIRDSSGLSRYFRPYHPTDIMNSSPKYFWDSYLTWSHYNLSLANKDATEYDLYYCINHGGAKTSPCSMDGGDVTQPIILLRCNRAYLCHYEVATQTIAHHEWRKTLGISASDDLYEVSGCLLRLALWPTEELWDDIDEKYYQDLFSLLLHRNDTHRPSFGDSQSENKGNQQRHFRGRRQLSGHLNRQLSETKAKFQIDDPNDIHGRKRSAYNASRFLSHLDEFYQIGIHFRCGDHSYANNFHEYDCRYEPDHPSSNSYMLEGNPYQLSLCTREILLNHTKHLFEEHRSILTDKELETISETRNSVDAPPTTNNAQFIMFFIASDNPTSASQIKEVINYSHTLVSPQGCHVEWDHSWECLSLTLSYWFMMSFSRHLSIQIMDPSFPAPTSSFSRYAGMYGLHTNPFRSGKLCEELINNLALSRRHHNNWFC